MFAFSGRILEIVTRISYDSRSFLIDGNRRFLISGEMHYPRIPREYWPRVLDLSKEAGLNCIASYVFWNAHEPQPGVYDFSGNADLGHYLSLCRERGLVVILRLGPYICAETNYGGFPSWLRDIPGITLRTWNEPYIDRLQRYFRQLVAYVKPHLASNGGPVALVQVENEYENISRRYGEDGARYMDWIAQFAADLGIDVPVITCYGGAKGAIECVNGFSTWQQVRKVLSEHPGQPGLWTENWPGWYDIWGHEHHIRDPYEIAYEILRFIQNGGSGVNYYMWMGGTNFGRSAMYLQTTRYDFDGALDEYGRRTEKYRILTGLHQAIHDSEDVLLEGEYTQISEITDTLAHSAWILGDRCVHVAANAGGAPADVAIAGRSICVPAHAGAVVIEQAGVVCRLWEGWPQNPKYDRLFRSPREFSPAVADFTPWKSYTEPLGRTRGEIEETAIVSDQPLEQLALTQDKSDYCWYVTEVTSDSAREVQLHLTFAGDYFYIFVNGRLAATSPTPLVENRGPILGAIKGAVAVNELEEEYFTGGREHRFQQRFTIPLQTGSNEISILSCALGMIKGDWMISMPMNYERKGLWGDVLLDGAVVQGWRMIPLLLGERLGLHEPLFPGNPHAWSDVVTKGNPLTWFYSEFTIPESSRFDPDTDWAFDAVGLDKGLVWVNGHLLGRYWTIVAQGYGPDRVYQPTTIMGIGQGEPTQRTYHIPAGWLREVNALVILSETGAEPSGRPIVTRRHMGANK